MANVLKCAKLIVPDHHDLLLKLKDADFFL
jgi:hypothetical protein